MECFVVNTLPLLDVRTAEVGRVHSLHGIFHCSHHWSMGQSSRLQDPTQFAVPARNDVRFEQGLIVK